MLSASAHAFATDLSHRGPLEGATHYGVGGAPGGGPYFELWLLVSPSSCGDVRAPEEEGAGGGGLRSSSCGDVCAPDDERPDRSRRERVGQSAQIQIDAPGAQLTHHSSHRTNPSQPKQTPTNPNKSQQIRRAAFRTHGCPSSFAVGAALCRLIESRDLERAQSLDRDDLIAYVGPVAEGKEFNYDLAIEALKSAKEID